jgi:hypothetical protein
VHQIGMITRGPGMWLNGPEGKRTRMRPQGWEHFR